LQRRSLHINPLVALANLDKTGLERHFFSTLLEMYRVIYSGIVFLKFNSSAYPATAA
jgi:hypothetical protein